MCGSGALSASASCVSLMSLSTWSRRPRGPSGVGHAARCLAAIRSRPQRRVPLLLLTSWFWHVLSAAWSQDVVVAGPLSGHGGVSGPSTWSRWRRRCSPLGCWRWSGSRRRGNSGGWEDGGVSAGGGLVSAGSGPVLVAVPAGLRLAVVAKYSWRWNPGVLLDVLKKNFFWLLSS